MKIKVNSGEQETTNPLVSVIVPSYNHEKYIIECIESIVNQSYKNIQLIVIDDGSTDKSPEILVSLKNKYGFTLVLQENHGVSYTLSRGIKEFSNGKYITFCASDDFWSHDKINKQVQYMILNPECPMCYSKCYYIDDNSQILTNRDLYKSEKKFKGGSIFEDVLLVNFHLPVSYLFTKEILEQENYFHEGIICEDFYMNLKISNKYKIGYINERLFYYRFAQKSEERIKSVIESQKDIIDQYAESIFYKKAIENWRLRALESFSGNKNFKSDFFKQLWAIKVSFRLTYWKSLIRMIITTISHK